MTENPRAQREVSVAPEATDTRLDRYLADTFPEYSRRQIQRWITDGHVLIDGQSAKQKQKIHTGQLIAIYPPPIAPAEDAMRAVDMDLDVLYEDHGLVVLNKPAGVIVHPGAGTSETTLVHALLGRYPGIASVGDSERPGIVHRLDRGTSGVLVVALNDQTLRALSEQFQRRETTKHYLALCYGMLAAKGTLRQPIGRHPTDRKRMSTRSRQGREAVTHWRVREYFGKALSWVDVEIETGRTHQIRVHLTNEGHPIVGDPTYGGHKVQKRLSADWQTIVGALTRPALHAWRLTLTHPTTHESMTWEAPLPEDMTTLCMKLRDLSLREGTT